MALTSLECPINDDKFPVTILCSYAPSALMIVELEDVGVILTRRPGQVPRGPMSSALIYGDMGGCDLSASGDQFITPTITDFSSYRKSNIPVKVRVALQCCINVNHPTQKHRHPPMMLPYPQIR